MIHDGVLHDVTNFSSDKWLVINSCNIQHNNGQAFTVVRKNGRVDYHILYVAKGSCRCLYAEESRILNRGDFVLYPPGIAQRYTLPDAVDTVTMWLHFTGTGVPEILEEVGLAGGVFHACFPDETEQLFRYMINMNAIPDTKSRLSAKGYLLNVLASFVQSGFRQQTAAAVDVVRKMLEYINFHWQKELNVSQIAQAVCLSNSRAAHLFKETVGESIYSYIERIRIAEAKRLLLSTDMPISEIGTLIGYTDALYFSRKFKASTSLSPRKYRSERGHTP